MVSKVTREDRESDISTRYVFALVSDVPIVMSIQLVCMQRG